MHSAGGYSPNLRYPALSPPQTFAKPHTEITPIVSTFGYPYSGSYLLQTKGVAMCFPSAHSSTSHHTFAQSRRRPRIVRIREGQDTQACRLPQPLLRRATASRHALHCVSSRFQPSIYRHISVPICLSNHPKELQWYGYKK